MKILYEIFTNAVLSKITRIFRTSCILFTAILCDPSEHKFAFTGYTVRLVNISILAQKSLMQRAERSPLDPIVPSYPVGHAFFGRSTARAQSRGDRLVTVVSVGWNCVLAAQMRYALSTFIRTCHPPMLVAIAPNRRCFGLVPRFAWYGNFFRYATAVSQEHPHDSSFSLFFFLYLSSPVYATYGTYAVLYHPGSRRHS